MLYRIQKAMYEMVLHTNPAVSLLPAILYNFKSCGCTPRFYSKLHTLMEESNLIVLLKIKELTENFASTDLLKTLPPNVGTFFSNQATISSLGLLTHNKSKQNITKPKTILPTISIRIFFDACCNSYNDMTWSHDSFVKMRYTN
jgi:hypothetical protein